MISVFTHMLKSHCRHFCLYESLSSLYQGLTYCMPQGLLGLFAMHHGQQCSNTSALREVACVSPWIDTDLRCLLWAHLNTQKRSYFILSLWPNLHHSFMADCRYEGHNINNSVAAGKRTQYGCTYNLWVESIMDEDYTFNRWVQRVLYVWLC